MGRKGIGSPRKQLSQTAIKAAANRRIWPRPAGAKAGQRREQRPAKPLLLPGVYKLILEALDANSCETGVQCQSKRKKAGARRVRVRTLKRSTCRPSVEYPDRASVPGS